MTHISVEVRAFLFGLLMRLEALCLPHLNATEALRLRTTKALALGKRLSYLNVRLRKAQRDLDGVMAAMYSAHDALQYRHLKAAFHHQCDAINDWKYAICAVEEEFEVACDLVEESKSRLAMTETPALWRHKRQIEAIRQTLAGLE